MANEATLVLKYEDPIDFIVADGTAITKGAILGLTSPRTASAITMSGALIAGIAARDKVANDGRTRLAVFRRGIFRMTASGAIKAGDMVWAAAFGATFPNTVMSEPHIILGVSGARVLGTALADIADAAIGEIELNITGRSRAN
jgi:hypothetical protein